jgi:hypothetical protein
MLLSMVSTACIFGTHLFMFKVEFARHTEAYLGFGQVLDIEFLPDTSGKLVEDYMGVSFQIGVVDVLVCHHVEQWVQGIANAIFNAGFL